MCPVKGLPSVAPPPPRHTFDSEECVFAFHFLTGKKLVLGRILPRPPAAGHGQGRLARSGCSQGPLPTAALPWCPPGDPVLAGGLGLRRTQLSQ